MRDWTIIYNYSICLNRDFALSRTVLICDLGVVRHSPHEQPKQFGMESINNMLKLIEESNSLTIVEQWHNKRNSLISDVDMSDDLSRLEAENDSVSDDDLSDDLRRCSTPSSNDDLNCYSTLSPNDDSSHYSTPSSMTPLSMHSPLFLPTPRT